MEGEIRSYIQNFVSFVLYFVGHPPICNDMGRYIKEGLFKHPRVIPHLYIHVTVRHYRFHFNNQPDAIIIQIYSVIKGVRVGVVVKALHYKPAGHGFDSRWCLWNFSVT